MRCSGPRPPGPPSGHSYVLGLTSCLGYILNTIISKTRPDRTGQCMSDLTEERCADKGAAAQLSNPAISNLWSCPRGGPYGEGQAGFLNIKDLFRQRVISKRLFPHSRKLSRYSFHPSVCLIVSLTSARRGRLCSVPPLKSPGPFCIFLLLRCLLVSFRLCLRLCVCVCVRHVSCCLGSGSFSLTPGGQTPPRPCSTQPEQAGSAAATAATAARYPPRFLLSLLISEEMCGFFDLWKRI